MNLSSNRVFITCGAGFVLSHVVRPILELDPQAQLTLLVLAPGQDEADRHVKALMNILSIAPGDRRRISALAGDLRLPRLGLADVHMIDSNMWINGSLPYKLGPVRVKSVQAAQAVMRNFLELLDEYCATVESVDHYVQMSSIYVGGRSSQSLPESLYYAPVSFGNLDYCKFVAEMMLRAWQSRADAKVSVVRIPTLLSADVSKIGGAILLLSRELLGFGRFPGWPGYLPADGDSVIRVVSAELAGRAIARLLMAPPREGLRVVNLSADEDKITLADYASIVVSLRKTLDPAQVSKLELGWDPSRIGSPDVSYSEWLRATFGLLFLCTQVDPEARVMSGVIGEKWFSQSEMKPVELLKRTLASALRARFIGSTPYLGETLIYLLPQVMASTLSSSMNVSADIWNIRLNRHL